MSGSELSAIIDSILARQPLPPMPKGLSLDDGYGFQQDVSKGINASSPIGWKAGVTDPKMQAMFVLSEPLIGSLYTQGYVQSDGPIIMDGAQQIECEIAILLDADNRPKFLYPAVEFVYMAFSEPTDLTPGNAVAVNLGADRFLLGEPIAWQTLDSIPITLSRNGETLLETQAPADLAGLQQQVDWMLSKGETYAMPRAKGDHILLLGTLGQAVAAEPGDYRVDYGPLGTTAFEIRTD